MPLRLLIAGLSLLVALSFSCADEPPPAVRADLYGDPLPVGALARLGTVRLRHAGLSDFRFVADGKEIVSAGSDRVLRHWELETGRPTRQVRLQGKSGPGRNVALTPDGKTLAAIDKGRIVLWDAVSGAELKTLPSPPPVNDIAHVFFSPDGKTLAVGTWTPEFVFWDWQAEKERRLPIPPRTLGRDSTFHARFSPDGRLFAAGGGSNQPVCVFDFATGRELHRFHCNAYTSTFSRDSRRLIASCMTNDQGGRETVLRVYELATGKEAAQFPQGSTEPLYNLVFSPDGRTLACGASDRGCLIDIANGRVLHLLPDRPWGLSFSPDGKTLLFSAGHRLRPFDVVSGAERLQRPGEFGWSPVMIVSPDGKLLAAADWLDRAVSVWDTATGRLVRELPLKGEQRYVRNLWFSKDGRTLAACQYKGFLQFWETASGAERRTVQLDDPTHPNQDSVYFYELHVSADGTHVCTLERIFAPESTRLARWDLATGKLTAQQPLPANTRNCAWPADGSTIAVAVEEGLKLIEVQSGSPRFTVPGVPGGSAIACSHDGRLLATRRPVKADTPAPETKAEPDGVTVWELATGREAATVVTGKVEHFCLTPNNRCLVTTDESFLRVWDLATGKEKNRWPLPEAVTDSWGKTFVYRLVVSPDGRRAYTALADGSALVWDLTAAQAGPAPPADAKQLDAWWQALADADAKKAHQAIWALIDRPDQAVPLLKQRLTPAPKLDVERVNVLVKKLDSDRFAEREQAVKELAALEEQAEPTLRAALMETSSPERKRRLESLLARPSVVTYAETLRRIRAIEVLEHIGTPAAQEALKAMAAGEEASRATQEAKAALGRKR